MGSSSASSMRTEAAKSAATSLSRAWWLKGHARSLDLVIHVQKLSAQLHEIHELLNERSGEGNTYGKVFKGIRFHSILACQCDKRISQAQSGRDMTPAITIPKDRVKQFREAFAWRVQFLHFRHIGGTRCLHNNRPFHA